MNCWGTRAYSIQRKSVLLPHITQGERSVRSDWPMSTTGLLTGLSHCQMLLVTSFINALALLVTSFINALHKCPSTAQDGVVTSFQLQWSRSLIDLFSQILFKNRSPYTTVAGSEFPLSHKKAGVQGCPLRVNSKFHTLCLPAADHRVHFAALLQIGYRLNDAKCSWWCE